MNDVLAQRLKGVAARLKGTRGTPRDHALITAIHRCSTLPPANSANALSALTSDTREHLNAHPAAILHAC